MEFRTIVDVPKAPFQIEPREEMLFVGSCFADSIGRRFQDEQFRATVNPFGTMYNPASVLHTMERYEGKPRIVFITLGTNHVYRLKETGEIVDNCQKRPASLFQEEQLTVDECADYLCRAVDLLRSRRPDVNIVLTVSPIRYRKYGYHESQLSKATLLLAVDHVISTFNVQHSTFTVTYFPAYEIVTDELRDYRFYADDMLHPSSHAVEYIWERLVDSCFSPRAKEFLREWAPLKAALAHRPFNPDSPEYRQFMAETRAKVDALLNRYH
ncbi:MAG: GSCFA domain-containing protein [Prevotella sp.]|nr:GSCFA domain-containing protein [Prevotella sp.]